LNDITAHVDFSAVRASALATGLSCIGYGSQASFLLGCDFAAHFTARAGAGALAQASLAREANTLVSEAEMGELFKVIALARTVQGQSLGFAGRDRQQALGD
jgi:SAM-dependent MidA family methyltransferase